MTQKFGLVLEGAQSPGFDLRITPDWNSVPSILSFSSKRLQSSVSLDERWGKGQRRKKQQFMFSVVQTETQGDGGDVLGAAQNSSRVRQCSDFFLLQFRLQSGLCLTLHVNGFGLVSGPKAVSSSGNPWLFHYRGSRTVPLVILVDHLFRWVRLRHQPTLAFTAFERAVSVERQF